MDWKAFFINAGIEAELSREYATKFEENRYGFCDIYRAIFPIMVSQCYIQKCLHQCIFLDYGSRNLLVQ